MKFVVLIFALFALFAATNALKNPDVCGLDHSADGNGLIKCAAFVPSFSYDNKRNECVSFNYGGCGGNKNRFHSKEQCEEHCKE